MNKKKKNVSYPPRHRKQPPPLSMNLLLVPGAHVVQAHIQNRYPAQSSSYVVAKRDGVELLFFPVVATNPAATPHKP